MSSFFQYIKNPVYSRDTQPINWKDFFTLLIIYFLVVIQLGVLLFLISLFLNVEHKLNNHTFFEKISFGIILAPVVEELLFRLLLVLNKRNLFIFFSTNLTLAIWFLINGNYIKFCLFALLVLFTLILNFRQNLVVPVLKKHYKLFFYGIAVLFATLHVFNFNGLSVYNVSGALLLVIPQLILGLMLGYIRIRYGLLFGILFHAIINISILLT
jgi:hypothetical protein